MSSNSLVHVVVAMAQAKVEKLAELENCKMLIHLRHLDHQMQGTLVTSGSLDQQAHVLLERCNQLEAEVASLQRDVKKLVGISQPPRPQARFSIQQRNMVLH